ncbi:MAG TPA: hypothetical protein DIT76_05300 [Spartobacteria bacterium]|nr:hypothetical protein [Spartobacteria bacterium]
MGRFCGGCASLGKLWSEIRIKTLAPAIAAIANRQSHQDRDSLSTIQPINSTDIKSWRRGGKPYSMHLLLGTWQSASMPCFAARRLTACGKQFEFNANAERILWEIVIQPKDMKPTATTDRPRKRGDRLARLSPIIDCNYQAPSYVDLSGGHCGNVPAPSFRNISRDYFRHEARCNFASEAALFVLIVATAALAIANGAVAAIDFLRALGYL